MVSALTVVLRGPRVSKPAKKTYRSPGISIAIFSLARHCKKAPVTSGNLAIKPLMILSNRPAAY
jgi:hypothetical protein